MPVSARSATATDVSLLADLVEEGITAALEQRGSALWLLEEGPWSSPAPALASQVDDPTRLVAAGCVDDVPVGVLLADRRPLPDGRAMARIRFVFVHPQARGIGVGEALVDAATAWALDHECAGIDGVAFPGDRETKNLYERAGLTARAIIVHRSFGREAGEE